MGLVSTKGTDSEKHMLNAWSKLVAMAGRTLDKLSNALQLNISDCVTLALKSVYLVCKIKLLDYL